MPTFPTCSIAIITQAGCPPLGATQYLLDRLCRIWRAGGVRIAVYDERVRSVTEDVVLMHIDRTDVTDACARFCGHPCVINGRAVSIAKDLVSDQQLSAGDAWNGPVIVKTRLNYGGVPETNGTKAFDISRLSPHDKAWGTIKYLSPHRYPIFDSVRDVPTHVWDNAHLIVEKLLCERTASGRFAVREWYFLGDREFCVYQVGAMPIVKTAAPDSMYEDLPRCSDEPIPERLRSVRQQLGLEFGRIDFAMVEGNPVLYDANKTLGITPQSAVRFRREIESLAAGMVPYLSREAQPRSPDQNPSSRASSNQTATSRADPGP